MHIQRFVPASFIALALLAGCGGEPSTSSTEPPAAGGGEHTGDVQQGLTEGYVLASDTQTFPSWWWPSGTRIKLQNVGSVATPVHAWCNSTLNASFTLAPSEYKNFTWNCFSATIYVHNQGTPGNTNQVIYVRTE